MELSSTKIDAYLQCPLKYRFRYIDGIEPEETSAPLVFGSAVHGTLKHFHKRRMEGKKLSSEEVAAAFAEDWEAACAVPVKWNGSSPEQLQEQGIQLLNAYLEAAPISEPPLAVEQKLHAPVIHLGTGEMLDGVGLVGIIDRIDPGIRPVELKTSSQSYSQLRVDISLQFTIYSYLLAYYHECDEIDGDYEIIVKTKTPKFQRLSTHRCIHDFDRLFRIIKSVSRGIESGIFHPSPSHMFCPGCDYAKECVAW
ncbi:MAG: PD-(D/E)XK nuclease superfamily protein [bacterium ADurb.Bin236]|nr:MAG: PD-(D/E)XK nuclease superfamily protein [bacterium ADurb.Bin236]